MRVRPLLEEEAKDGEVAIQAAMKIKQETQEVEVNSVNNGKSQSRSFKFDKVLGTQTSQ